MAGEQRSRVLRPRGAFDRGLHQIAREADGPDEHGEQQGRSGLDARGCRDEKHDDRRGAEPRERALPGLPRADTRRDLAAADPRADHVRDDVGRPRGEEREKKPHRQRPKPAAGARVVREPELDEVAEEVPEIQRPTEREYGTEDRRLRAAAHPLFEEDGDRDGAERRDERTRQHGELTRRGGAVHVRDDEQDDEQGADQPRSERPVAEERAELEVPQHGEDRDEDRERRPRREQRREHDDAVHERGAGAALEVAHVHGGNASARSGVHVSRTSRARRRDRSRRSRATARASPTSRRRRPPRAGSSTRAALRRCE